MSSPQPSEDPPSHRRDRDPDRHRHQDRDERLEVLREAAIRAEFSTGVQERTEEAAKRHVVVRLATIAVGFVVLIGGLVMMILPGPGIVGILVGLGILSRELPWAERTLEYAKKRAKVDQIKQQPAWVQGVMWTMTALAVAGSVTYLVVR